MLADLIPRLHLRGRAPIRDASGRVVAATSSAVPKQGKDKKFYKHMQEVTERCLLDLVNGDNRQE